MDSSVAPFKIAIPDAELDLLQAKLKVTRLPNHNLSWTEENQITTEYLQQILDFWLKEYSWRDEEARINDALPQYMTTISTGSGEGISKGNENIELNIHFVHSPSTKPQSKPIPLLFIHGWPGSFIEIIKGLKRLNEAGFTVVAPSLPGYGFSSYVPQEGFDLRGHARVLDRLMVKLGYNEYVVQGGDWGSSTSRRMGLLFPERVKAVHINMMTTPQLATSEVPSNITPHESRSLQRTRDYFFASNSAYSKIQSQRPLTLGHAMHDSPIGLLSYIADKLITWSDSYPWTPAELITWTLMHYWPGPTTGFCMYHENASAITQYMNVPFGVSSFAKEIIMAPKVWAQELADLRMYKEHEKGGHFAMWERPDELVGDVVEFVEGVWKH